ncbi:MAG: SH3 domain-containing protein [Chloroflexi bacterium]|nr:SH3 domain-containing protein [Chloroflexota bacterium]
MMSKLSAVIVLLVAALLGITLAPGASLALAQSDVQASVLPQTLNVRGTPSPDGIVLGQYAHGTVVRVSGREDVPGDGGVWVYTRALQGGIAGWVRSDYLEFGPGFNVFSLPVLGAAAPAPPADGGAVPTAGSVTAVTTQRLNFRAGPGLGYAVIRTLPPQTAVALIGRNTAGSWVQAEIGETGWLFTAMLRVSGDISSLPVIAAPGPEPGAGPGAAGGVVSGVGSRARQIFLRGQALGNRRDVFSKIGDSITASPAFLYPIGVGAVQLGDYGQLQAVINYFSRTTARDHNSFANTSLAARSGWTSGDLLDPARSYSELCLPGEMPLVCEYRVTRPAVALIMVGTNDAMRGVGGDEFRWRLGVIVQTSSDMGVIPVLSTIPPNLNGVDVSLYNSIIASVASQAGLPLWDYYHALEGLPNSGMSGDGYHPSLPPNGETGIFTPDYLRAGYTMRNLTALQVLDAVWKGALY